MSIENEGSESTESIPKSPVDTGETRQAKKAASRVEGQNNFRARIHNLTTTFTSPSEVGMGLKYEPITEEMHTRFPLPPGVAAPRGSKYVEVTTTPVGEVVKLKVPRWALIDRALHLPKKRKMDAVTNITFSSEDNPQSTAYRGDHLKPGYTINRIISAPSSITLLTETPGAKPVEITQDNASALNNLEKIAEAFKTQGGFTKAEKPKEEWPQQPPEAPPTQ